MASTQIVLIPKKSDVDSFKYFRPISLCNITFKIITKNIAERIKSTLTCFLSKDQHAFLKGRNILDVVANTQESLYSMFTNKSNASILKIDLQRAYDSLDWGFIRCLLAKIGLRSNNIKWIMACVENVSYVIIINGIPSPFFHAERGLRQRCPLSPLLFILTTNSLSVHINIAFNENRCRPLKICRNNYISHNLFVDDVLIFAMLCRITWSYLHVILKRFQDATGLHINKSKSTLFHNDINMETTEWVSRLFGIEMKSIKNGFKYLGFHLKAKGYSKAYWLWIIDRYHKKISIWEYRSLSLAGRIILAQAVLTQMVVYWAHLFSLPASIIQNMNKITANFIWGGKSEQRKYHLVKMDKLSKPKNSGGWGLLDLRSFWKALLCKSLWKGIYGEGPLRSITKMKYMGGKDIVHWYRVGGIGSKYGFAIWLSFRKIEYYFLKNLIWSFQSDNRLFIGTDSFISRCEKIYVLVNLLSFFHRKGFFTWDKLIAAWQGPIPLWREADSLGMCDFLARQWNIIRDGLISSGIYHSLPEDVLVWKVPNARSQVCVKDIYLNLIGLKIA